MSRRLHWLEVPARCRAWLTGILGSEPHARQDEVVLCEHVARFSLRYACETLDAIATELLASRPLQAAVLVRTMFELAVRVRWASVHEDGWRGLVGYWVEEHRKALTHVRPEADDSARDVRIRHLIEKYEDFAQAVACPCPKDFLTVLREMVAKADAGANTDWADCLYNGYRDLCRYAHANMTICAGGVPLPQVGRVLLVNVAYATVQLVEAARHLPSVCLDAGELDDLYGLPSLATDALWD